MGAVSPASRNAAVTFAATPSCVGFLPKSLSRKPTLLLRRRDLVLLDLAVGQDERRQAQSLLRRDDAVAAQGHPSAQRLRALGELGRLAERGQAGGEVIDGLLGEVGVGVRGEERAVELPVLQAFED